MVLRLTWLAVVEGDGHRVLEEVTSVAGEGRELRLAG